MVGHLVRQTWRCAEHCGEPVAPRDRLLARRLGHERRVGPDVVLSFRKAELPNLVQWRMPGHGDYVMGLEPANCLAEDYNSMASKGLLRHIEPGQTVETHIRLQVL